VFATPVYLDVVLSKPAVILPGLTIAWGTAFEEYPLDFRVIAFNENGQEVARKNVQGNNSLISEVHLQIRRASRIRLEITRWKIGNRRARIGNIFLGHIRVYTKDNLLAFSASHEIDPVSGQLPKYEIAFDLDNRNGDFDPLSPNSMDRFALERQEVTARYGFRRLSDNTVEYIPGGQYFLTDWTAPRNGLSASFKARDLLGFLDGIYHKGIYRGFYDQQLSTPESGDWCDEGGYIGTAPRLLYITLYDLAEEVLKDALSHCAETEDKKWEIHESLKNFRTMSPLPLITYAECLQLIANAAGAAITFDREGILHIAPLPSLQERGVSHTLSNDNSYSRPEVEIKRPLKNVQVSTYTWQADYDDRTNEPIVTTLYDQSLQLQPGRNEFIVEYSDSAVLVELVKTNISHKIEYDLYAQCASLIIHRGTSDPDRCHIVIKGRVIRPAESTIVVINNEEAEEYSDRGETLPLKNILITDVSHARTIANALLARYKHRKTASVDWRLDPSQDLGDFIALQDNQAPEGSAPQEIMRVLSTDFRFSGAFIGKSEGVIQE